MEEYKVLITTSGLGKRLGNITNYTNKALVKIGDKPAISHIIENYPNTCKFVITIGHFGSHVKQYLHMAYPNIDFTFVDVDLYQGEGSSLLYSMLQAEQYLHEPFIYNTCDTLVEQTITSPSENWCGVYSEEDSDVGNYRTVNTTDRVIKINDKGEDSFSKIYIGLSAIHDHKAFWKYAKIVYNESSNDQSLSDCHVINRMLSEHDSVFTCQEFETWIDIGNIKKLEFARKQIKSITTPVLDKYEESIYHVGTNIIKFFTDANIVSGRIERSKQLSSSVPTITNYSDNFYSYDFIQGSVLSNTVNDEKMQLFLEWASNNLWKMTGQSSEMWNKCEDFYFHKTRKRINDFLKSLNLQDEPNKINGIMVPAAHDLLNSIPKQILCTDDEYCFHGDFILENIIDTNDGNFKLIDWRQDFAGEIKFGDIYYDFSKLNHNLTFNHDVVSKNLFYVENTKNEITVDILTHDKFNDLKTILQTFIIKSGFDYDKVKLLTPLIWINMAPLHAYPLNKFLFYFGKYKLYKAWKEILNGSVSR